MQFNTHRVNRLARQALVKLGKRSDPNRPHAVQLMRWALDEGVIRRTEVDITLMREAVATLESIAPEQVMEILAFADDAPGQSGTQARYLIGKEPREIACVLLRDFGKRLARGLTSKDRFPPWLRHTILIASDPAGGR